MRPVPRLVAFCGAKGSGKSAACEALVRLGYKRLAFADPLREVCSAVFGLTPIEMGDPVLKECEIGRWPHQSPRFILQRVGTESFRTYWPDVWIEALKRRAAEIGRAHPICVSDLRFPNEQRTIKDMGGVVVRITRPDAAAAADAHESESHWRTFEADLDLINDSESVQHWQARIARAVREWNFAKEATA
jgi:hypothetical protein